MHQRVLHVLAYASDQVNVVDKQDFEKALRDVSLVRHEFSEDIFGKLLVFLRGMIARVGLRQLQSYVFPREQVSHRLSYLVGGTILRGNT